MKISNISIKNFRNIIKADVNFGNINVITGFNSSGKSNFLLGLYNSLSMEKDYSKIFQDNIVTYQRGKDQTEFKVTINDEKNGIVYFGSELKPLVYLKPNYFEYKKVIDKTSSLRNHVLLFNGVYENNIEAKIEDVLAKDFFSKIEEKYKYSRDLKIFYEDFTPDLSNLGDQKTKVIKQESDIEDKNNFIDIFKDYQDKIKFWISESGFTSNLIYKFVVEKHNNDIYEQVVSYLKNSEKTKRISRSFENAKFIFLVADIQKNEEAKIRFKKELELYTQGIVTELSIKTGGSFANKGELSVTSPQGPNDIYSISTGTAVLLFLITLKNWINISNQYRSYEAPSVMMFDELEANIHPNLATELNELLRAISKKIQLFMSTHSPKFIDFFEKKEVFLIKDTPSFSKTGHDFNRSNIFDYEIIIRSLPENKQEEYMKRSNSELFVEGLIDNLFPA
jgi:predicted ATP-dependent endonuclease of OLD family